MYELVLRIANAASHRARKHTPPLASQSFTKFSGMSLKDYGIKKMEELNHLFG